MSGRRIETFAIATLFAALVAGCGDKPAPKGGHGHAHGAHGADEAAGPTPVSFKPGQGLQLAAETAKALGVTTAEVGERRLAQAIEVTASVFNAGPPARAVTIVPVEIADQLEHHPPAEAKVISVRRDLSAALKQVEIVLELRGSPALGTTVDVMLRGPERSVAAVPRVAVHRTATGTFVYVVNGDRLLRTEVKTGASDGQFIEITDGLYPGDVVAAGGVEQLWLTELRLTKGGGHSH